MLPLQFFGQNIHFAINLFAALVFFAVFWLYLDAWTNKKRFKEFIDWLGFLLVALSFLVSSTIIEQSVLGSSILGNISVTLSLILRIIGYGAIIVGQVIDPLQPKPKTSGLDESAYTTNDGLKNVPPPSKPASAFYLSSIVNPLHLLLPLGSFSIAGLYWRRATRGLERHLKPISVAFLGLFVFDLLSLTQLLQGTDNPLVSRLVASFGLLWILQQVVLLGSVLILGRWVWQYLTRRFMSQLFMIFTSLTLAVFLLTTVSFTYLLVNNVQKSSLDNLEVASSVLSYALDGKKAETLAITESVASNTDIAAAVAAKDHDKLVSLTSTFLRDKKQSSLIITNSNGQVLLRAEDPSSWGDSLSSDTLIRRTLIGQSNSSLSTKDDVLAPLIYIKSASPIRDSSKNIIGSVVVGLVADSGFVDGIKKATGLDSAMYAGNVRSATTFVAPDGVSRWIGVKETNQSVSDKVLKKGQTYKGTLSVLNRQFLTVYAPIKDIDNTIIGMLFIGQPQVSILQAAGRSVELTFLVTAFLLVIAILPAYYISRYLTKQLD